MTKLQDLPTDMAHDWETARLSDGRTHAIVANYGGAVSTVYQLSDPRVPPPERRNEEYYAYNAIHVRRYGEAL